MANERARELRRNRTAAERRLWWNLRELRQAGFRFRQQVPIYRYIVDFACLSKRLIIEVDGGTHSTDEEAARDARREQYLRKQGFRVMRVWNSEVRENIDGVMDTIVDALAAPPPVRPLEEEPRPWRIGRVRRYKAREAGGRASGPPPPSPPRKGEGRSLRHALEPHYKLGTDREGGRVRRASTSPSRKDVRRAAYRDAMLALAHRTAAAVVDPEIPVLTLEDLGVLRGVERCDGRIVVKLTPTYTGCPATDAIRQAVELALAQAGIAGARVETVLSPPWSSDDITEEGRRKLEAFGIAPPSRTGVRPLSSALRLEPRGVFERGLTPTVACPKCGSTETVRISEFGSTACKALWRCQTCAEPFDYFKCI